VRRALLSATALVALAASIPLALAGRAALAGSDGGSTLQTIASAYRNASAAPAQSPADLPLRLAGLSSRIASARDRAQADVLVGAVLALPAGNGSVGFDRMRQLGGGRLLDQAAGAFRSAIQLDGTNEAAKYDLELLLKSQAGAQRARERRRARAAHRAADSSRRRRREKRARGSREQHAAGTSAPGSGY
jgi:hypothetical protein